MDSAPSIRGAEAGDADAISAVVRRCFSETLSQHHSAAHIEHQLEVWSPGHVRRLMAWPGRRMLVATSGGEIVGTACLWQDSIRKVFVDPSFHGGGIGRMLLLQLEQEARAQGLAALSIQSGANAVGFYQRLGYGITGVRDVDGERYTLLQKRL